MPVIIDPELETIESLTAALPPGTHAVNNSEKLDAWLAHRSDEYAVVLGPNVPLEQAISIRETALVRSPIDGIVTQINSRQGEMATGQGIAKVVDMKQLRVFATLDELHLPRLTVGVSKSLSGPEVSLRPFPETDAPQESGACAEEVDDEDES